MSDAEIVDRVMLAMVNEASRCLQEKVVDSRKHLDMAMILGIGFPPFRGGLLRYADAIGIDKIVERLQYLSHRYGDRFAPSAYLQDLARSHRGFY